STSVPWVELIPSGEISATYSAPRTWDRAASAYTRRPLCQERHLILEAQTRFLSRPAFTLVAVSLDPAAALATAMLFAVAFASLARPTARSFSEARSSPALRLTS